MWILDRQRYWAFFKAYVICFVSLVGLYIVIDAFTNLDEFTQVESKLLPLLAYMGKYYLIRTSLFFDRLCGVITMMAAIFTVTWMQRNNEHLAMLAAGISTQRVIRPVLVSAFLMALVAVGNQELIIPRFESELQRRHADDGTQEILAYGHRDINGILIQADKAVRTEQSVSPFHATFPAERFGLMFNLEAPRARYIPEDDPLAAFRGGWLVRGGDLQPPDAPIDGAVIVRLDPDPALLLGTAGLALPAAEAASGGLPAVGKARALADGTYFLRSNLDFQTMIQERQWYQYASTPALMRSLKDPTFKAEQTEIAVFLHTRTIRPLLTMTLLFLSLPLVLGGMNKNMFINLGKSLGTSALFYLCLFVLGYLGNNRVLAAEQAAWFPLIAFGCLAAWRWDGIRT
jgi:lipopolysaccharide export system permease protein